MSEYLFALRRSVPNFRVKAHSKSRSTEFYTGCSLIGSWTKHNSHRYQTPDPEIVNFVPDWEHSRQQNKGDNFSPITCE